MLMFKCSTQSIATSSAVIWLPLKLKLLLTVRPPTTITLQIRFFFLYADVDTHGLCLLPVVCPPRGGSRGDDLPRDGLRSLFPINKRILTGLQFTTNILTRGILWRLESTNIRFRPGIRIRLGPSWGRGLTTLPQTSYRLGRGTPFLLPTPSTPSTPRTCPRHFFTSGEWRSPSQTW